MDPGGFVKPLHPSSTAAARTGPESTIQMHDEIFNLESRLTVEIAEKRKVQRGRLAKLSLRSLRSLRFKVLHAVV